MNQVSLDKRDKSSNSGSRFLRFRLKGLLATITLLAMSLGIRNAIVSRAQASLFSFPGKDIPKLFPDPKVVEENGRFRVTFRTRYRPVFEVARDIGLNQPIAEHDKSDAFQITFESYERGALEELIELWPGGDRPTPDCVISGRVSDQNDRAVAEATVSLFMNGSWIGEGETRKDGTFSVRLASCDQRNSNHQCLLRVKWQDASRDCQMDSPTFNLRADETERLLRVQVRR
ncbi:MAG: carboxypeptidase regulatory-like domain-containing protein [Planctomycetales bacterium]|nr:carboxypeptidase regulatory-like domain-containing protein [Planctomycetales bacterium]